MVRYRPLLSEAEFTKFAVLATGLGPFIAMLINPESRSRRLDRNPTLGSRIYCGLFTGIPTQSRCSSSQRRWAHFAQKKYPIFSFSRLGRFYQNASFSHDIEILIGLPHGQRCVRSEQLVAEDLGQEDVVGLVSGFKLVAADSSVGTAEVAWFPGFVQRAESGGNVLRQLRAGGGVNGIGAREGFQGPELIERADDLFWIGQNGNRVRLEDCAGSVACFELALEDESGGRGASREAN